MKVFIGVPTGTGQLSMLTAQALHVAGAKHEHSIAFQSTSLLAFSFNRLLAAALTARADGYTHFCLMHSDIIPEAGWLDKLGDMAEFSKADILSAVVPIKTHDGLTSTAIDTHPYHPKRLTLKEVHALPPTFTHPKLLINTGLLLIDMRKPWIEHIRFHIDDALAVNDKGKWEALTAPEDWNFSRDARDLGVSNIYATREVRVDHAGQGIYSNMAPWGRLPTDVGTPGPQVPLSEFSPVVTSLDPEPRPKSPGEGPLPLKSDTLAAQGGV